MLSSADLSATDRLARVSMLEQRRIRSASAVVPRANGRAVHAPPEARPVCLFTLANTIVESVRAMNLEIVTSNGRVNEIFANTLNNDSTMGFYG
jgi:hypothetical protein